MAKMFNLATEARSLNRRRFLVVSVLALPAMAFVASKARLSLDALRRAGILSGKESKSAYMLRTADGLLNDVSFEQITVETYGAIDGWSFYRQIEMAPNETSALVNSIQSAFERRCRDKSDDMLNNIDLDGQVINEYAIPSGWPRESKPSWWWEGRNDFECITRFWEVQSDERSYGIAYYSYSNSKVIQVWEWDHQHRSLPSRDPTFRME